MHLMGAPMDVVSEANAVRTIVDAARGGRGHWTITANLDHVRRYRYESVARELIDEADLVVADGMPLIWASRLAGEALPERVSGSNMVWSICEAASSIGLPVYLLGGDAGVAERAARIFQDAYPGLEVAGTTCPPVGFERDPDGVENIQKDLINAAPAIVFVALGFPKQDLLIRTIRSSLPGASLLGVGISLSYATGDLARAPDWMCNLGLEWAHRLAHEPTRHLVRRYLVDGLPFGFRLLLASTRHRFRRSRPGVSGR